MGPSQRTPCSALSNVHLVCQEHHAPSSARGEGVVTTTYTTAQSTLDALREDGLLARRRRTLGTHSPLFYNEPLEIVSGSGVWLTDATGRRYLDAYNNVPHVGHANPVVAEAIG